MKYLLILLIAMLPAFAIAGEESTADQCKCSDPESGECKYEIWACLWGDKLNELEDKAMNLGELFRAAIVDNEYAPLEKHLEFPIEIMVLDHKENEQRMVADAIKYHFIADNLQELQGAFKAIIALDQSHELLETFQDHNMHYGFYRDEINLHIFRFLINAKIRCADFKPTTKHPELILPQDRRFCNKTSIAVKRIRISLN